MSTYSNSIIFSISEHHLIGEEGAFAVFLLMEGIDQRVKRCIGSYKGQIETSYITSVEVFHFIDKSGWLDDQESVLEVSGCNKMYTTLHYREDSSRWGVRRIRKPEFLGSMHCVSETVAKLYDAWTFVEHQNRWYVAVKGNPDHAAELKGPDA